MKLNLGPITQRLLVSCASLLMLWMASPCALAAPHDSPPLHSVPPVAPPPAPPVEIRLLFRPAEAPGSASGAGASLYSIGVPTDQEQLYLEYINRARANPAAEAVRLANVTDPDVLTAYRYFGVDLSQLISQMAALPPAPPLSMNAKLLAAARLHSQDMLTNGFQGHASSDGSSPGTRITRQGYAWVRYGENVYACAKGPLHGHAGFEVDWGYGPAGMQSPPGHRLNIHNRDFREVGIGVVTGSNSGVGPQLVTQDFAAQAAATPFITGVAYYDLNGNGAYDAGEGIGGIEVSTPGATCSALTAPSGGYSLPVSTNGFYAVNFLAPGLPQAQRSIEVSQGQNAKADYVPSYSPPTVTGLDPAAPGPYPRYRFSPVGAATAYQWKQSRRLPYTRVEGAEEGLGQMVPATSGDYPLTVSDVKAAGTCAFHLAHSQPVDQILTLNRTLRVGPASRLSFASRLGWATSAQLARVQISTNAGAFWLDLWQQAGTDSSGQSSFSRITNDLSAFAGQELSVRFLYDFVGGSYYPGSNSGRGWYLDDIAVAQAEELTDPVIADVSTETVFEFAPAQAGDYILRVRPQVGGRWLDWGPPFQTSSASPSVPLVRISTPLSFPAREVQFEFDFAENAGTTFSIETASNPAGPWIADPDAILETIVPGAKMRVRSVRGSGRICFYRVAAR